MSWASMVTSGMFYLFAVQCYNNATWNGKECVCAQGYFGYQCKDVREYFFIGKDHFFFLVKTFFETCRSFPHPLTIQNRRATLEGSFATIG